jgi:hypothetical protein
MSNQDDTDSKVIAHHLSALMEHFDTVQIFVTRHESGTTVHLDGGRGNWFARHGQIMEWVSEIEQ